LKMLFDCLNVNNVLTVVRCLMQEHRILVFSKHLSLVSICCEAVLTFLYPFNWPHVYVPVIPEPLLDFVYSPTP